MPNISSLLEQRLTSSQSMWLKAVSRVADQFHVQAYLVGGPVRDVLLGVDTSDIDVSVVGATPEFAYAVAGELGGEVTSQSQFGTYKLVLGDETLDIATARSESYAHPGVLPTVTFSSIDDDLGRRDFTINSMAFSISEGSWGELLDPFRGSEDLSRKVVKVLHGLSFVDDPTRILRAIRYVVRLGFEFEADTKALLIKGVPYLDRLSGDRVRHEFERVFMEQKASAMLEMAQSLGVLSAIYSSLEVDEAAIAVMESFQQAGHDERPLLILSAMAYSIPGGRQVGLVARFNMDNQWASVVTDTCAVKDMLKDLSEPGLSRSRVYHLLKPYSGYAIKTVLAFNPDSVEGQRLALYLNELQKVEPILNGNDLMALGIPEGPRIGNLLTALLDARLDGLQGTREGEEAFIRNLIV